MALNASDIAVLVAFAFAQPLFDLIARSPAILVVHRAEPFDLLALVFYAYVPALALILIEVLVLLLWKRILAGIHIVFLTVLLALNLLPLIKRVPLPGTATLVLAVLAGTVLAIAYMRVRTWRWSLLWLSPAVLLFPVILLCFSPASGFLFPDRVRPTLTARIANPVPVIVVVFDEFPLASLMDQSGGIDSDLYPNFAELTRSATWYRNATTVGESTLIAVPAIVSGKYPDPAHPRLPDASGYPDTLFTMLAGVYRLNVQENDTRLCPKELCGGDNAASRERIPDLLVDASVLWLYAVLPSGLTKNLPDITQSWKDFAPSNQGITLKNWQHFDSLADWHDRAQQFRKFTASVRPVNWPTLHFLHVLLPHAPWEYLPSGQKFTFPEMRIRGLRGVNDRGEDANQWTSDAWAAAQNQQKHLLQVAFVDHLVGAFIAQLRENGLYDSSLLVFTADHGTSFRPTDSRRSVTATNHADLMHVPLFIKYPRQSRGGIDDRPAENVDILPTILDVLKASADRKLDGHSLLAPSVPRPTRGVVTDVEKRLEFATGLDDLRESVAQKLVLFGGAGKARLYTLGDIWAWTGRSTANATTGREEITYEFDREAYYSNVDSHAPMLVTNITGTLNRRAAGPFTALRLAVAVNGAVAAVTQSYRDGDKERFSAIVPETAFHEDRNDISVFEIRGATQLQKLRFMSRQQFSLGSPLLFGAGGNATAYYEIGWSNPEPTLTWTDGHVASLYLPVARPVADVQLRVNLCAFTQQPRLPLQKVRVLANDREIANWRAISDFQDYTALVPRDVIGDSGLEITFELPDAAAPFTLDGGGDSRVLGIAVSRIDLSVR